MVSSSPARWARAFSLLFAGTFILCFLWGLLLSDPVLQEFHRNSLRIYLLDTVSVGANIQTLIAGTIISAVWGAIAGIAIALCFRHCDRK